MINDLTKRHANARQAIWAKFDIIMAITTTLMIVTTLETRFLPGGLFTLGFVAGSLIWAIGRYQSLLQNAWRLRLHNIILIVLLTMMGLTITSAFISRWLLQVFWGVADPSADMIIRGSNLISSALTGITLQTVVVTLEFHHRKHQTSQSAESAQS